MVGADPGALDERDPEEAVRGVEGGREHPVEGEVGLELGLVEAVARPAHLFRVEAPVPGLDRLRGAFRAGHGDQRVALRGRPRPGRLPHLPEEACHRRGRARHPVDERVVRVVGVAVQARLLVAQREDLAGDRAVVVRAVVLAAPDPGLEGLLAQVAASGKGEERHDEGARQRDHGHVAFAALAARRPRRRAQPLGQSREVVLAAQRQAEIRLVGQHVLAERRRQRRHALDDLPMPRPGGLREARPFADEIQVHALEKPQGFRRQPELAAAAMQPVDAVEEPRMQPDRAVVRGEARHHLALDGLQRRRRLGLGEVEEDPLDAHEVAAAPVERGDRVLEGRRLGEVRDRVDLRPVRPGSPCSNAGTKCSGRMRSNGGRPKGVCQGSSRGLPLEKFMEGRSGRPLTRGEGIIAYSPEGPRAPGDGAVEVRYDTFASPRWRIRSR